MTAFNSELSGGVVDTPDQTQETTADTDSSDTDGDDSSTDDARAEADGLFGGVVDDPEPQGGSPGPDPGGNADNTGSQDAAETPDRRTVEVAETGSADETELTRNATQDAQEDLTAGPGGDLSSVGPETGSGGPVNNEVVLSSEFSDQQDSITDAVTTGLSDPTGQGFDRPNRPEGEGLPLRESEREQIESGLENQTGADLDRDDFTVTAGEDGNVTARLNEQGAETVAVQDTPGRNIPVLGGVLESGTRARTELRQRTAPAAERFDEFVPTAGDVAKFVGAAAPAAAAEPTPVGEIGTGLAAGAGLTAAGVAAGGAAVRGENPTARTDAPDFGEPGSRSELDVGRPEVQELSVPEAGGVEELQPGETDISELEPTSRQRVAELSPGEGNSDARIQTAEQIGRQREESQQPTISDEDIITDIGEPEQPAPSNRERQRRDDLDVFERGFPTGEQSVVGRGTERVERAETPEVRDTVEELPTQQPVQTFEPVVGAGPVPGQDQPSAPVADLPQQQEPVLDQIPLQEPVQTEPGRFTTPAGEPTGTGTGTGTGTAEPTATATAESTAFQAQKRRPRLPGGEPAEPEDDDGRRLLGLSGVRDVVVDTSTVFNDSNGDGRVEPLTTPEPVVEFDR